MSKQAEGGKARAASLTKAQRTAIAKKGAEARWSDKDVLALKETHPGELHIGDTTIQCSVLEDKTRVLSQRAIIRALGSSSRGGSRGKPETDPQSGGARLPRIFESNSIKPFLTKELTVALGSPIAYRPKHGGRQAYGYEATLLPKVCSAILEARDAGALTTSQTQMAIQADMLIRALAQVGIIALIDEVTGFQADRDKDDLQKLLEIYLSEERLKWVKTFPNEFFDHIFRLRGWVKPIGSARPQYMGTIINQIVYEQLPKGVLDELKNRNPIDYISKHRKWKHHQFLSEEIGQPDLRSHILQLLTVMRLSDGWSDFLEKFIRAFRPSAGIQQELEFDDNGK